MRDFDKCISLGLLVTVLIHLSFEERKKKESVESLTKKTISLSANQEYFYYFSFLYCHSIVLIIIVDLCCHLITKFLFLGYLEDQKCAEAAKLFLETSPHLQECRTVLSCGRRFSTRVNGLTLMDVVEKFSAISTMSK